MPTASLLAHSMSRSMCRRCFCCCWCFDRDVDDDDDEENEPMWSGPHDRCRCNGWTWQILVQSRVSTAVGNPGERLFPAARLRWPPLVGTDSARIVETTDAATTTHHRNMAAAVVLLGWTTMVVVVVRTWLRFCGMGSRLGCLSPLLISAACSTHDSCPHRPETMRT
jgi:hypothetical protein